MAQVINTNIASLNSQRHLNNTQDTMRTAMERLSSGLRINSAKDDAAGLAISNRMTAQIDGMDQAARNANDGISLAQTGEGALQQITNNLQRMRELGVQSRNATNTSQDRESLNAEFQQLLQENDRLAQTTAFNGRNILDGSLGTEEFQVGANVGETISVDVSSSMRTNAIGNHASVDYALNDYAASTAAPSNSNDFFLDSSGDLAINGVNVASVSSALSSSEMTAGRGANSAYGIAEAINLGTDDHGVTATAQAAETTLSFSQLSFGGANTAETYTLEINGKTITQQTEGSVDVSSAEALATQINNASNETGVSARVDGSGKMVLSADDGRNIEIKESVNATASVSGFFGNTGIAATGGEYTVYKGSVRLDSDTQIAVASNDAESQGFSTIADGATDTTGTKALSASDILTATNSDAAIHRIDSALSDVDSLRGTFGAIQSRFESTVSSLETSSENLSAARSRIQDADFAAETAKMSKAQVLQQAGTSMLAQANQQPQSVLALLQ